MAQEGFRTIIPVEASPRRSDRSKCNICGTKFTIFEHRQMCRMCQDPVCHPCSRSRKVFRAGTKPKRVCDNCVKTNIVAETTNSTIESGNRPPLSLSASDAADTRAERTLPPPTPTGGDDSAPTPLAMALARLQVQTRVFFGGRRPACGDNAGKKQSGVQIAATTEVKTPSSSSSPPPAQQQDWAQGGMGPVTNGGQGQAESDYVGPDLDCVIPAVAADEVQKVTYNEVAKDAEASHAQLNNQADMFDRAMVGLDVSHLASSNTADTPTNYYTPAAATPAYHKAEAQNSAHNKVAAKGTYDVFQADVNTKKTGIVNDALFEAKADETDVSITTTVDTLAGATLSIDIPADAAAERLTGKVQVQNEVTKEDSDASNAFKTFQTNAVDGVLVSAKLEVALGNDAENATANLASTSSQKNGARLTWVHFTSEIICGCLAAVVMGLAVGSLLFERD